MTLKKNNAELATTPAAVPTVALQFDQPLSGVVAFATRRGEVGVSAYSSFNCCPYVGDDPTHVDDCRRALLKSLRIDPSQLKTLRQVHSVRVVAADEASPTVEADAVVTNRPGEYVGVYTADCVPILLVDPIAGIAAAAHAGWKGTLGGIATLTVEKMTSLGADVERIHATFGPAICGGCYEVGQELIDRFAEEGFPMERISRVNPTTAKPHLDLVEANVVLLERVGIAAEHISRSNICTRCAPDTYFSARALGVQSGRVLTAIAIVR